MNARLIIGLSVLLSAVACVPLATPAAQTSEPTPYVTDMLAPTETLLPTETPAPEPSATPDFVATLVTIQQPAILESSTSPDGQWRAEVIRYDCTRLSHAEPGELPNEIALEQLRIFNSTVGSYQTVSKQMLNCGGLGGFGFHGYGWSPNSRYFYFDEAREGFPDGLAMCVWYRPLLRVDAETGSVEPLLSGVVSPEAGLIAMPDGNEIVLWDFDDGEIARVPAPVENTAECAFPSLAAWALEWASPDQLRLSTQSGEQWMMDVATREWKKTD